MKTLLLLCWLPVAAFLSQTQPAAAAAAADLQVTGAWGDGFTANIVVTNSGSQALPSWTLAFDLDRTITGSWNGVAVSHTGSRYVFRNESWNGAIPAGGSVTLGLQASGSSAALAFANVTLNGVAATATVSASGAAAATAAAISLDVDSAGEALQLVVAPGVSSYAFTSSGTYAVVSNNPAVATAAAGGGTLTVTAAKPGRASLRIQEAGGAVRNIGVRVDNADGSAPGLPDYLAIGSVSEDTTADLNFWSDFQDPAKNKRVDIRYIYLNGGASNSIGDGWNWRQLHDGERASRFVEESLKLGMVPFFVWYNIPDSGESYYTDKQHIESATYLEGYFQDLKHALEITREAAGGETVGWVLEPDFLGYFAQNNPAAPSAIPARTDAAYSSGVLDAAADPQFPNTLRGLVEAINYTIRKFQPAAKFGWQFNLWASPAGGFTNAGITGKGIVRLTDTLGLDKGRQAISNEAKAIADYYISAGILTGGADFISIDKYGLDAGFEGKNADPAQSTWFWNAVHWTNYLVFVNALHDRTALPVTLWQIPAGRINSSLSISPYTGQAFPALPNTTRKYEDSAATYFFGDSFATTGTRAAYFGQSDGGVSGVSSSGSTVTWSEHLSLAKAAGVTIALFGPGVGESTENVGSDEDYFWISKVQDYYKDPVLLAGGTPGIPLPDSGSGEDTGSDTGTGGGTDGQVPAQSASFKFDVTSNWGTGYNANVSITNTGTAAITGWSVSFDLDVPETGF
jgi:hypothetical protein